MGVELVVTTIVSVICKKRQGDIMNRKLRMVLAIAGAIVFFLLFTLIFPTLGILGAVIGFVFVWFLAGLLHWGYSKRTNYVKRMWGLGEGKSQNDRNVR